jgi:DNA-damage-inducible protein J
LSGKVAQFVKVFFRQMNHAGLSITEAITLFYRQVKLVQGLPFEVRIPNQTTRQTFQDTQDTDEGQNLVQAENAQEMFDKPGL